MASIAEYIPQGLRAWAAVLDSEFRLGTPTAQAIHLLPAALTHVQASSPLGVWMREITPIIDRSTLEIITWDLLELCRLTESQVPASSPLGRWMKELSFRGVS